jgi:hypothetical protein
MELLKDVQFYGPGEVSYLSCCLHVTVCHITEYFIITGFHLDDYTKRAVLCPLRSYLVTPSFCRPEILSFLRGLRFKTLFAICVSSSHYIPTIHFFFDLKFCVRCF